jgi:hypothetical protein
VPRTVTWAKDPAAEYRGRHELVRFNLTKFRPFSRIYLQCLGLSRTNTSAPAVINLIRIIDSFSFIVALGVGAYIRYGIDGSWFTAIGFGVVIFILMPFIVSRVWGKYLTRRMERHISDGPPP